MNAGKKKWRMSWNHSTLIVKSIRRLKDAKIWTIVVAVISLSVLILVNRTDIVTWSGYDWIRPEAAEDDVRILVAELIADTSGKYSAELENALRNTQQRFRNLERSWNPSEDERLDTELEREKITQLLRRHNSEILVHGYVGMDGLTVMVVPANVDQSVRRYVVSSKDDFNTLTDEIELILVNEVQSRIEREKWEFGQSDGHALLDLQIEDLLRQTESEGARRKVLFQSAFTKNKLGFWRNDQSLEDESAKIYEELLSDTDDPREEALIRINLGLYYQTRGQRLRSDVKIKQSTEHFSKAEEIVERFSDIRRWVKVRNLQSSNDIWLSHITGNIEYLGSAIKRQLETLEDTVGWISQGEMLLVEQEMVGAEVLLAYVTKNHSALKYFFSILQSNREQWYRWAEEANLQNNPWVQALIECTALVLIDPMNLEQELNTEIDKEDPVTSGMSVTWSNQDVKKRRLRIELWLAEAKNGPSEKTYSYQLAHLANLVREEALRTHNVELLSRSFDLTQQFRVLERVESGTIPYAELDLSDPNTETVFRVESIFALACADRSGIKHVLKLLERSANACVIINSSCEDEIHWIDDLTRLLNYGLQRWDGVEFVRSGSGELREIGESEWANPETHAIWLRWQLQDLPSDGQSFCPSRVPWVG